MKEVIFILNSAKKLWMWTNLAAGIVAKSPKCVGLSADGLVADSPAAAQQMNNL